MKLSHLTVLIVATIVLTACNFTLAEDVTPPPNYVSPTPAPTLGPLFPAEAPSTQNGAAIFAEKCAACHGKTGLGDGPQGIQLGVTVPAFGLPEIARPASPAQWYTTVTRGNMERFMPPFNSLNDQERWDVVAYAMTLHMKDTDIAKGKQLFEANCANCSTDFFKDQSKMSALSEVELARMVKQGGEGVPAFGSKLTDEDVWAVAAYLRTLSFNLSSVVSAPVLTPTPEAVTVTEAAVPAEGTPVVTALSNTEGTAQAPATSQASAVAQPGVGTVAGSVDNKTGKDLPSNLKVTLHGYDHGTDPSAGPQEVLTLEGTTDDKGSFKFENVEIPLNRIFIAEVNFEGTNLRSTFAVVKDGDTIIRVPPIPLYNKTEDTSKIVMDEARIFFEYSTDSVQVFNVYMFRNPTNEMIVVKLNQNGEVPFIKSPEGSSGFGYEPMQDTESLLQTENGFAIPPSEKSYGLVAFASLPKAQKIEFSQEFVLPAPTVTVFVPEGITVKGGKISDLGVQKIQDSNFQLYELAGVGTGETVKLSISGTPKAGTGSSSTSPAVSSNRNLLIGAGALGVVLILAGAWLYWRDRNRVEEETGQENGSDEFETAEDVMDAILALDDLHRARKISDEAYQKRRAELKEILKEKM